MNTNDTNTFFEYDTYDEFRQERLLLNHESTLKLWYSLPAGLPTLANTLVRRQTPKQQRSRLRNMKLFAFYCTLLRKTFLRKKIHEKGIVHSRSIWMHFLRCNQYRCRANGLIVKEIASDAEGEGFVYCTWVADVDRRRWLFSWRCRWREDSIFSRLSIVERCIECAVVERWITVWHLSIARTDYGEVPSQRWKLWSHY